MFSPEAYAGARPGGAADGLRGLAGGAASDSVFAGRFGRIRAVPGPGRPRAVGAGVPDHPVGAGAGGGGAAGDARPGDQLWEDLVPPLRGRLRAFEATPPAAVFLAARRTTIADPEGRFRFRGLPAGGPPEDGAGYRLVVRYDVGGAGPAGLDVQGRAAGAGCGSESRVPSPGDHVQLFGEC